MNKSAKVVVVKYCRKCQKMGTPSSPKPDCRCNISNHVAVNPKYFIKGEIARIEGMAYHDAVSTVISAIEKVPVQRHNFNIKEEPYADIYPNAFNDSLREVVKTVTDPIKKELWPKCDGKWYTVIYQESNLVGSHQAVFTRRISFCTHDLKKRLEELDITPDMVFDGKIEVSGDWI